MKFGIEEKKADKTQFCLFFLDFFDHSLNDTTNRQQTRVASFNRLWRLKGDKKKFEKMKKK